MSTISQLVRGKNQDWKPSLLKHSPGFCNVLVAVAEYDWPSFCFDFLGEVLEEIGRAHV